MFISAKEEAAAALGTRQRGRRLALVRIERDCDIIAGVLSGPWTYGSRFGHDFQHMGSIARRLASSAAKTPLSSERQNRAPIDMREKRYTSLGASLLVRSAPLLTSLHRLVSEDGHADVSATRLGRYDYRGACAYVQFASQK